MRLILFLLLLIAARPAQAAMLANSVDYEVRRWAQNNIPNQGGTIGGDAYIAANLWMNEMKWWGIRPRLGVVNLYLGDNTNAMICNVIYDWNDGSGNTNETLVGFVAADYSQSTGLTGNTSTKHLGFGGLSLQTFSNGTNLHFAAYVRTGSNEGSDILGVGSGLGTYAMAISNAGNTYVFMGANTVNVADSNGTGFCLTTRRTATDGVTYRNATTIVTDSGNDTGSLPSIAYVTHAVNINGSILARTSRTISYTAAGYKIDTTMVTPYNIGVQALQKSMGRQVP